MDELIFLESQNLTLRPLLESDFSVRYLNWLNEPEVNEYSQRRPYPVSWQGMRSHWEYYGANPEKGYVLAIITKDTDAFIGTISIVNIQLVNRCAEIGILIGDKEMWNRSYGSEALYTVTKHGFQFLNMHKMLAGTFNPAFAKCCEKLGWTQEGAFRERIYSGGAYHDQLWFSMLDHEFSVQPQYELEAKDK